MKYFTLLTLLCVSNLALSQIEKGRFSLGGSMSYSKASDEDKIPLRYIKNEKETKDFSFEVNVGYLISNTSEIMLVYENSDIEIVTDYSTESGSRGKETIETNSWGAGVNYRKYFSLQSTFYVFTQVGILIGTGDETTVDDNRSFKEITITEREISYGKVGLVPGLIFFRIKTLA